MHTTMVANGVFAQLIFKDIHLHLAQSRIYTTNYHSQGTPMSTRWIHCFLICCLCLFSAATLAQRGPEDSSPDRSVLGVLFTESAISKVMPTIAAVNSRRLTEIPVPELLLGSPEAAGRFPIAEIQAGHSAEAILSRYVFLTYSNNANTASIAEALARSPEVEYVDQGIPMAPQSNSCRPNSLGMQIWTDEINWGQNALSLSSAHLLQRGRAFTAVVDTGIYVQHSAHVPFDDQLPYPPYLEGNFLKSFSYDVGRTSSTSINYVAGEVDEYKIRRIPGDTPNCDANSNDYHETAFYGHGTHVAGILAAKPVSNTMGGACLNCPLSIARYNKSASVCNNGTHADTLLSYEVRNFSASNFAIPAAFVISRNIGVQVVNLSSGAVPQHQQNEAFDLCAPGAEDWQSAFCQAIQLLHEDDVIIVSAAGNEARGSDSPWPFANFPARDTRVWSVGGVARSGSATILWRDEWGSSKCGSNFGSSTVDFAAPAKAIYSTMPNGANWGYGACHEWNDGFHNNGYGYCTGTSMATPFISGVAALLRSAVPTAPKASIFSTLAASGQGYYSEELGHGVPNARLAVENAMGRVAGNLVKNRATPLFSLYGFGAQDFASTTNPNMVLAWARNPAFDYRSDSASPLVRGYAPSAWPVVPRADVYLLTSHVNPYGATALRPLYRMRYVGATGSNPNNADVALVEPSRISDFYYVGYKMEGLEGYIFPPCTSEPKCIPPGTTKLWRAYHSLRDDHAVFPQSRYTAMVGNGYQNQLTMIGYAITNVHSDQDNLVDGFEFMIGTRADREDSDCDGLRDDQEYPPFSVPVSDPRSGACPN